MEKLYIYLKIGYQLGGSDMGTNETIKKKEKNVDFYLLFLKVFISSVIFVRLRTFNNGIKLTLT